MVTPLQIDSYTRDLDGEYDAYAIAQLAPLAYDSCYRPRLVVGLDSQSQLVAASSSVQYGMHVQPGSLIYGMVVGSDYGPAANWSMWVTDLNMGLHMTSDPIAQTFLVNFKGNNYPYLFRAPRPVVGDGSFLVEVWNQLTTPQFISPVFGVLEVR